MGKMLVGFDGGVMSVQLRDQFHGQAFFKPWG